MGLTVKATPNAVSSKQHARDQRNEKRGRTQSGAQWLADYRKRAAVLRTSRVA